MLETGYRSRGESSVLLNYRHGSLVLAPMSTDCLLSVVIPARDERETIGEALRALAGQRHLDGSSLDQDSYEVIVLANNCEDETAAVARAAQLLYPALRLHVIEAHFPPALAHIGVARRALMDAASARFHGVGRPGGVIVSTDADTIADPFWLAHTLRAVEAGADAVGGRIVVGPDWDASDERTRQYHLRDVGYRMLVSELVARLDPDPADPWPRHFQHFGPSLAVTAAAYELAGGLPPLESLEDVALYHALRRVDARIRHDPAVRVRTSPRSSERTAFGFSAQLRDWSHMGAVNMLQQVPQPGALEAQARATRDLRELWKRVRLGCLPDRDSVGSVAERLAIDPAGLGLLLSRPVTYGCLLEQVEELQQADGVWARRWPEIDIQRATAGLRERLGELRSAACSSISSR